MHANSVFLINANCNLSVVIVCFIIIVQVGAAHCFSVGDNPSRYTITCGEHSLQKQDTYEVTLQVTEVIIHPRYVEASSSGFDIAVYKV